MHSKRAANVIYVLELFCWTEGVIFKEEKQKTGNTIEILVHFQNEK